MKGREIALALPFLAAAFVLGFLGKMYSIAGTVYGQYAPLVALVASLA